MATQSPEVPAARLFFPSLTGFYENVAQPLSWLVLRLFVGGALVVEGWPKIVAPFAQTGFVEGIGFYPGWFFSPLLAVMQFGGGFLIAIGLLTRPVALANALMLAVTIWFHVTRPYGDAFLTSEGIEFLRSNLQYLTDQGQARLLSDGGAGFLHQVQAKAEFNSTFWTAGAAIIAAFGGGKLSIDRRIDREF